MRSSLRFVHLCCRHVNLATSLSKSVWALPHAQDRTVEAFQNGNMVRSIGYETLDGGRRDPHRSGQSSHQPPTVTDDASASDSGDASSQEDENADELDFQTSPDGVNLDRTLGLGSEEDWLTDSSQCNRSPTWTFCLASSAVA